MQPQREEEEGGGGALSSSSSVLLLLLPPIMHTEHDDGELRTRLGSCLLFPVNGKKAGVGTTHTQERYRAVKRTQVSKVPVSSLANFSFSLFSSPPNVGPFSLSFSPISWEIRNITPKINDQTGKGKMEQGKKREEEDP